MVAALGETTAGPSLPRLRDIMLESPEGRRILKERPRITSRSVDLDALRQLPDGTFGRAYVDWLERCGVTPDTREPARSIGLCCIPAADARLGALHRRPRAGLRDAALPRVP
jgi:ubiquinone biosynthesis protein COQ4